MKLLFVGSSHLACLMEAIAEKPKDLAGLEARFVAVAGPDAEQIYLDGDRVRVALDRVHPIERDRLAKLGRPDPDIREADAIFVFNTIYSVQPLIYGVLGRPHVAAAYSWSYLGVAIRSQLHASAPFRLAAAVRAGSGRPTFLCHQPFRDRNDPQYRNVAVSAANRDRVFDAFDAAAREADLEVVRQPLETILDNVFTDPRFGFGSVRLNGEKHGEDFTHMNAAYGRIYLRHVIASVVRRSAVRTADYRSVEASALA